MDIKTLLTLAAALSSLSTYAQKTTIKIGAIDGSPCLLRRSDVPSSNNAPQRPTYGQRQTRIDAVIVAGSGTDRDNDIVTSCGERARAETYTVKSSSNLNLYNDLFRQQVQQCIEQRDRRIPVYDVYFLTDEKCLALSISSKSGFTPGEGNFRFGLSPVEINAALAKPFRTSTWSDLPRAAEYKSIEVRYLYLDGDYFPDLPYAAEYGKCRSRQVVFFFIPTGLFRIAVRHLQCDGAATANRKVADSVAANLTATASGTMFFQIKDDKVLAGISTGDSGSIEWREVGSPKYENQNW